jgi:two-component system, NtrC family, sensor kinase
MGKTSENISMSKLLLIDDEKPTRKILGLYLRSLGYEVITAADGREGIELFEREKPPIVLTDIKMPGTDGLEVLKIIKQMDQETEVIVITGHGDVDVAIKSLELEASDFITKPIANDALLVALKRAEEKVGTKRMLREYTSHLEDRVKKATEELRERYEFEGNLIQHSIDGIIATDAEGNIVTFNGGAEKIFGYSRDDVVKRGSIANLYPRETAREIREGLTGKESENRSEDDWKEILVHAKGGDEIPVRFSRAFLRQNGVVIGSVSFFHDLREIKRLERELLEKERLSTIGQTVASLAHYIKNILYGLEGGVYIVNKGIRKKNFKKLDSGWDIVQRNISKLSELALDLLNYSKEREPEYARCSPNSIAADVCDLMNCKAREGHVEIKRDFDPDMGEAFIDPKGIHRSLLNLVSNAVWACMTDEESDRKHMVQVTTKRGKDLSVTLQVADNGAGMDEKIRRQLFSGLFSTKGSKGTGLGLLITQKIVQEHGGTVEVHSQSGEGSRFAIHLPERQAENDQEGTCSPGNDAQQRKRRQ